MTDIPVIDKTTLDLQDTPRIEWITVKDAFGLLWEKNPKLHDIGSIVESILEHGWQELPKYDATLKAIKAGNGRIEAIHFMERDNITPEGLECPRGVAITENGAWSIPVVFGVDAPSIEAAESYAIDSNNLTMTGGDFTTFDYLRMWDTDQYIDILKDLNDKGKLPKSVDENDLDVLTWLQKPVDLEGLYDKYGNPKDADYYMTIHVRVPKDVLVLWDAVMSEMSSVEDYEKVNEMLNIVKNTLK